VAAIAVGAGFGQRSTLRMLNRQRVAAPIM
jgi:hypothetical protein